MRHSFSDWERIANFMVIVSIFHVNNIISCSSVRYVIFSSWTILVSWNFITDCKHIDRIDYSIGHSEVTDFIYHTCRFTSLCKIFTYLSNLQKLFQCHVHHYQCLAVPVQLAVMGFVFWFIRGWNSRDVSMAGVWDCVKGFASFIM